jgi:4-amino-4-deoxy-L-arabinose transferase-like glycosyltransferase
VTVRSRVLAYIALALLSAALFLPGQASLPPFDRDEARYAQATAQMLETKDFLDIRFQDQKRYRQPAGVYWLQAASVSLLSDKAAREIWAYRVPSLLGAMAAVLLTAWIGNLLFGAPVGFLASALMAVSLILGVGARLAKTDAALLAAVLAAEAALAKIWLANRPSRQRPLPPPGGETERGGPLSPTLSPGGRGSAALFWLALGVGVMLKGPIILLVVFATILLLAISERRASWLLRLRPLWGVPLMLAVVLPWLFTIGIASDGKFFSQAIGQNLLGKVAAAQESHGAPPGYFLALFPVTFWPGSLFAALAIPFAWTRRRAPAVRFCLCWIAPTWIVFELVATKLPHYVMPTYPAIACLAAASLLSPEPRAAGKWLLRLMRAFAAFWLVVGIALAVALPAAIWVLEGHVHAIGVLTVLAVVPLLAATLRLLHRGRPLRAVACASAAALLLYVSSYSSLLPAVRTIWLSPRIADAVARARPCDRTIIASVPYVEPSLVFLLGTGTRLGQAEGAAEHLLRDPSCGLALVGAAERDRFLALMRAQGVEPREVERIGGLNYSNGRRLDLTLYAAR